MRATSSIVALALLACACGSCGGGGVPTQFFSAPNVPPMSGYLAGPPPATVNPSATNLIWVGDGPGGVIDQGYYRFDISAIPAGWIVEEAMFRVGQELLSGSPYATLGGQVVVDHIEMGTAFDPADWNPIVYALNIAVLSTTPTMDQKSTNIQSAVQADVGAGRTHTDIRLRFAVAHNGNGVWDEVAFNNQANAGGSNLRPILEIRYREP